MTRTRVVRSALALALGIALGSTGCSVGTPNSQPTNGPTGSQLLGNINMDVSKIQSFAVGAGPAVAGGAQTPNLPPSTGGGSSGASSGNSSYLNYIALDGSSGLVNLTQNPEGDPLQSVFPTPKYLLIVPALNIGSLGKTCGLIALRYADGALFCVPDIHVGFGFVGTTTSPVKWNATGDVIDLEASGPSTPSGYTQLFRLDFRNPASPNIVPLYTGDGYVEQFAINASGDSLYVAAPNTGRILRLVKADNSFQPFGTGEYINCLTSGPGALADQFFYVFSDGVTNAIMTLTKNGSDFTSSTFYNDSSNAIGFGARCRAQFKNSSALFVSYDGTFQAEPFFLELATTAGPVANPKIDASSISGLHDIKQIAGNDQFLILSAEDAFGNGILVRYDLSTRALTQLVGAGSYLFSDVSVLPDGTITFAGLRLSDQASVVAQISAGSSTIQIISTALPSVEQVIRLR